MARNGASVSEVEPGRDWLDGNLRNTEGVGETCNGVSPTPSVSHEAGDVFDADIAPSDFAGSVTQFEDYFRFLALRFVFFGAAAFFAFLRFAIVPSKLEMALSKTCCRESTARRFDYYRMHKTATPLNETCTRCVCEQRFDACSIEQSHASPCTHERQRTHLRARTSTSHLPR